MKLMLIANLFTGMCISFLFWAPAPAPAPASGQYADNPRLHFVPFKFDTILRGAFNISICMVQLLECFELMRPDVICDHGKYQDTICPVMKNQCHDYYGPYDSYSFKFEAFTTYCRSEGEQYYS